jgi:hypothetical protein
LAEIAEDDFNAEAAETAEILGLLCELCGLRVESFAAASAYSARRWTIRGSVERMVSTQKPRRPQKY